MLLENLFLFLKIGKTFEREHGQSYSSLFFFTFFKRASEYQLFSISQTLVHFFSLFLMNNFCRARCFISITKLLRDSNKNLEPLFGGIKTYQIYFLVFTPSVGVKHFWMDLDEKHVFALTPSVGVVHMWVVYT
jgi:hypothetical protein